MACSTKLQPRGIPAHRMPRTTGAAASGGFDASRPRPSPHSETAVKAKTPAEQTLGRQRWPALVDDVDSDSQAGLLEAACRGHADVVKELLAKGANKAGGVGRRSKVGACNVHVPCARSCKATPAAALALRVDALICLVAQPTAAADRSRAKLRQKAEAKADLCKRTQSRGLRAASEWRPRPRSWEPRSPRGREEET
eukprot:s9298_g3.t1